jgi:hypothetical protein
MICKGPTCEVRVCHDKCSPMETTFGIMVAAEQRVVDFLTTPVKVVL